MEFMCREEIKRLKAIDPSITHKEAFSTAAKNVRVSMTKSSTF